jgi:hypothetical protein
VDADLDAANWDYFSVARALGGCRGGAASAAEVGLASLLAQGDAAPEVCHGAPALMPDGVDGAAALDGASGSGTVADAIAAHLFARFLARAPGGDEQAALSSLADGCASDASCGAAGFAEAVCGALARSAAFLER